MLFDIIYLSVISVEIILAGTLLFQLRRSIDKLPEPWKRESPLNNFSSGVSFLLIYLILVLLSECVSLYLARHYIYNSFVFSIYYTLSTPFLFGFLSINTQMAWKRYTYFILYSILVVHLIYGGYYHPRCILPSSSSLIIFSFFFLAFLLQLTDLLLTPKSDDFRFQLKINLSFLIYSLIATIVTTFHWQEMIMNVYSYKLFFHIHLFNIFLFYSVLAIIFTSEIIKLRRG
ncbi:MAG: hypothetical protein K0S23_1281 [Fluviicola sp.]|jgi:hypothetical protein|uniref:hypothetical protein n=1 Tax=Fluviicola sp. TaxID=1917219 RepID=UPI002636A004|nr:hypothetical protein [Fluviicola sp.]MDF3026974.1 hypothetical protein [Fluviicola sp.]